MMLPLKIIDHQPVFRAEWLEEKFADVTGSIVACDFPVDGAENGTLVPGGYSIGRIINVDHHAPAETMQRRISSTNLAIERLTANGPEPEDSVVVISHTDCDSILSCGLMSNRLPLDSRLGDAAIAADHTGEQNDIADVLQELDNMRTDPTAQGLLGQVNWTHRTFVMYCHILINEYLAGGTAGFDQRALDALSRRQRKRELAMRVIEQGKFSFRDGVAFAVLDDKLDGEFFPALLPDAQLILLMTRRDGPGWDCKIRLGLRAPDGLTLDRLRIWDFDPAFGGRWNAGSNRRNGGTMIDPQEYTGKLAGALRKLER